MINSPTRKQSNLIDYFYLIFTIKYNFINLCGNRYEEEFFMRLPVTKQEKVSYNLHNN